MSPLTVAKAREISLIKNFLNDPTLIFEEIWRYAPRETNSQKKSKKSSF